jgi:hypothetical protein
MLENWKVGKLSKKIEAINSLLKYGVLCYQIA